MPKLWVSGIGIALSFCLSVSICLYLYTHLKMEATVTKFDTCNDVEAPWCCGTDFYLKSREIESRSQSWKKCVARC